MNNNKRKSDKPLTRQEEEELHIENEALRCENYLLKKVCIISSRRERQKVQAILVRSSFYYHQKKCKSSNIYQVIKELIKSIYYKHKGRYKYRRITDELNNKETIINHKTV